MQAKVERSEMWWYAIGVFLFLLLSIGAAAPFGLFSGMVIVHTPSATRRDG